MTLIVNLLGAPCAGKSTTRAGVFHRLKRAGVNVEEATEEAKDMTYEERHLTLRCQPYIFAKQLRNLERMIGKVDVIVTDGPIILSLFYTKKYLGDTYGPTFDDFVLAQHHRLGGLNYFINRTGPYNPVGRNQTEAEADQIAGEMKALLIEHAIGFHEVDDGPDLHDQIAQDVLTKLMVPLW